MATRSRRAARIRPMSNADNLPARGLPRLAVLVGRALTRRCPYCGGRGIFANWWTIKETCPTCGVMFAREEGYFLGTYLINLVFAEFVCVIIIAILLIFFDLELLPMEAVALTLAIGLPIFFYPFASTLFMAADLMIHPPRYTTRPPESPVEHGPA